MKVFKNISELEASVGEELGVTEWQKITQKQKTIPQELR